MLTISMLSPFFCVNYVIVIVIKSFIPFKTSHTYLYEAIAILSVFANTILLMNIIAISGYVCDNMS